MFSVVDVDLEKNSKVSHLWVVPMGGAQGPGAGSTASSSASASGRERQVTFWKEGESGGRFSPDGKQVLFVATDGANNPSGLSQIFLAPWDEATGTLGTPRRLTNVSTEADGAIWSPDSQRILFVSRVYPGCSDEPVWLEEDNCDRKQDEAAAANPVKAQIFNHLLYRHWDHYVGPKRSHVLVVSAADGNAVRDLTPRREIDDSEAPTFSLGGPMGYAWAPDSKEIAFVTNVDLVPAASTNNDVFTLRLDDPGARPQKISTSMGSDDGPAYSPDGKWLAFRSQERAGYESDRFRLMLFDRTAKVAHELELTSKDYSAPGRPKELPLDRWVDEFTWSDDSHRIFFVAGDQGEEAIYGTNVTGDDLHRFGKTAGEWGSLVQVPKQYKLVATLMRVDQPVEIAVADLTKMDDSTKVIAVGVGRSSQDVASKTEPLHFLTHLNDGVLAQLDLPRMDFFWFTGAADAKVQGFVIRPPKFDPARKYPLKFLIHGGPQGAWGDAWSYRWNPELMAASGYVVVMVNPRGSTGYGQAFIDGVNGDWGGKAYVDLMKGLDAAEAKYPFIDKSRECALGGSYGGFMADWILTHTDRFACIVTHDGMFNPQSAYGDTEELWFNEWEFRTPGSTSPAQPWRYAAGPIANDPFRKWSPMLSIQNAKTPTLVIHSQRDYRLDVSEGMQLFTALQRLNVPSKMLYFPDEGHWILKPQNSKLWYETVGDWCDRWTKTNAYALALPYAAPRAPAAAAAPAPAKAEAKVATAPKGTAKSPTLPVVIPKPQAVQQATAPAAVAQEAAARGQSMPEAETVTTTDHASFAIAISVSQDEVRVGSDVPVKITLRNVSNRQIVFGHRPGANNPEFSFEITVKNGKGQVVEETAYGREASDARRRQEEDRTVEYVQPGGSAVQTAHLAKLVSLSRPGWYTVRVSRKDSVSREVIRSNEVKFAVVP
jgi:dipeptidyl aminopeptidase/acylaminoacyl peptidase